MQLPRAPEAVEADRLAAAWKKEAAERAEYEEDAAMLRALRMTLRGIITAGLLDRRFRDFIQAPHADEDPEFWERVRPITRLLPLALLPIASVSWPALPLSWSQL